MRIWYNSTEISQVPELFAELDISLDEADLILSDEDEEEVQTTIK
jgi:hypothetical protein